MRSQPICSIPDCNLPHNSRGFCKKHYNRAYHAGALPPVPPRVVAQCGVAGCQHPAKIHSRALCNMHYQRWQKYGTTETPPGKQVFVCAKNGCDQPAFVRARLCKRHRLNAYMSRRGVRERARKHEEQRAALAIPDGHEWRVVADTPSYEVSRCGLVRRIAIGGSSRIGRQLKPSFTPDGYVRITLTENRKARHRFVHHLVALAFIGPRPSAEHGINHKDGHEANNNADNLEWATNDENRAHARANGLYQKHRRVTSASHG